MADEKKGEKEAKEEEIVPSVYWRPFWLRRGWGPSSMMREMDRMMDEFRADFDYSMVPSRFSSALRLPAVDIKDEGDRYTVEADLPGLGKEDVSVTIGEGVMEITAKKTEQKEESREDYIRRERGYMSFHRRLALPEDVDLEKVEAKLEDGVLRLALPKKVGEEQTKKKVEVK